MSTAWNDEFSRGVWVVTDVADSLRSHINPGDYILISPDRSHPVMNLTAIMTGEGRENHSGWGVFSYGITSIELWMMGDKISLERIEEAKHIDEDA